MEVAMKVLETASLVQNGLKCPQIDPDSTETVIFKPKCPFLTPLALPRSSSLIPRSSLAHPSLILAHPRSSRAHFRRKAVDAVPISLYLHNPSQKAHETAYFEADWAQQG